MSKTSNFDPKRLGEALQAVPYPHRIAFAALCCERMLPNYTKFAEVVGWDAPDTLRGALHVVWEVVGGTFVPAQRLNALTEECVAVTPDADDFDIILVSHAIDAGSGVCEALQLCIDGDPARAVNAASAARDTVDMHIQERDDMDYADPDFEEKILRDPLMVRELRRQQEDLELLRSQLALDPDFVRSLRSRYRRISNLDPVG